MTRQELRAKIDNFFKSKALELAINFIASKWAWVVSGPCGWILELILKHVWNMVGSRLVRLAIRKGCLGVDLTTGSIRVKKIGKAKDENDSDSYWHNIGNV